MGCNVLWKGLSFTQGGEGISALLPASLDPLDPLESEGLQWRKEVQQHALFHQQSLWDPILRQDLTEWKSLLL